MTREQKQAMSWLEYRSQVTGKSVAEIRDEMSQRGKKGGHPKGKELTEEHKNKLREAVKRNAQES